MMGDTAGMGAWQDVSIEFKAAGVGSKWQPTKIIFIWQFIYIFAVDLGTKSALRSKRVEKRR